MQEKVAVVIVAAGASKRMGRDKLWIPLQGRPILAHTITAFQSSPLIDSIVLVTSNERLADVQELCLQECCHKLLAVVVGGARRQDSVRAGLDLLATIDEPPQWVLIHDGARPFVAEEMLERGLQAVQKHQAVIAAVQVKDTIKRVQNELIVDTPERSSLWIVQTPQIFAFPLIHDAHHSAIAQGDVTDDATLLEHLGHTVAVFPGAYTNIKITTQEDLLFAELILRG